MTRSLIVCAVVLFLSSAVAHAQLGKLNHLSTYISLDSSGDPLFDEGLVEIAAYDKFNQRVFLTNGNDDALTVVDISDPAAPAFHSSLDLSAFGGPTSVAIQGSTIAVANEAATDVTDPGTVLFYDANNLAATPTQVQVGPLPDMVTFTPDGRLLVANEGEAPEDEFDDDDNLILDRDQINDNPAGSISIIDPGNSFSVVTADFATIANPLVPGADPQSNVRVNPNVLNPEDDLEPEYITVAPDGTRAYIALQENNTLAELNLSTNQIDALYPLGAKDHALPGQGLDGNKEDDAENIQTEDLLGLYMPDGIAAYEDANGDTFIVTANEGDSRDEAFGPLADEGELGDTIQAGDLDPAFPDQTITSDLAGLEVSQIDGDTDGDLDYDKLYTFGGRSFAIFDDQGNRVFDSGDDFEQIIASQFPANFNAGDDDFDIDDRSDDAGPEPEGVALGVIAGRTLAFIGIEKMGGVMVYDVTDPANASFLHYLNDRLFDEALLDTFEDITDGKSVAQADRDALIDALEAGTFDIAPEGLLFIPAVDSPNGEDLLVIANEVSGTTSIYTVVPEPTTAALLALGGAAVLARRRRA